MTHIFELTRIVIRIVERRRGHERRKCKWSEWSDSVTRSPSYIHGHAHLQPPKVHFSSSASKCHLRMSGASSHMMSFVSLSSLRVTSFARLVTLMVYSSRGVDQQLEAGVRRGACPASIFRRRPSLVHLLNHAQSLLVLRVHANARPWYRNRETKRNVGYCQPPTTPNAKTHASLSVRARPTATRAVAGTSVSNHHG